MYFLTEDQILRLHATFDVVASGMRYKGALTECREKPQIDIFGYQPYVDIYEKAAILLQCIVQQTPFNDGNKRTGLVACFTFLEINGYVVKITVEEGLSFALKIANKEVKFAQIVNWLKSNSYSITTCIV